MDAAREKPARELVSLYEAHEARRLAAANEKRKSLFEAVKDENFAAIRSMLDGGANINMVGTEQVRCEICIMFGILYSKHG
jgi:hypothetical protein